MSPTGKGISAENRSRLTRLIRATTGPFTIAEAAHVLDISPNRTRRFLAYLAKRRWLTRVRPGLYMAVPLDATEPTEWQADPLVVAGEVFSPCYVGGWSACEHWGLTDQLFRDVGVLSGRWRRDRRPTLQRTRFRVKVISPEQLFGTRMVWRGPVQVRVSDPARTILDLLDDPALGGGIRHVADVLTEWFTGELRDDQRLFDYTERLGNRSVYKRLGFIVETLAVPAEPVLEVCQRRMSTGMVQLDPSGPAGGERVARWSLVANVTIRRAEPVNEDEALERIN